MIGGQKMGIEYSLLHRDDDIFRNIMVVEGFGILARFKGLGSWLNGGM